MWDAACRVSPGGQSSFLVNSRSIMRKMADPLYFKIKINRIKLQADNTATRGAFALRFIADMYAGKLLKKATHFTDKHVDGEDGIIRYISNVGIYNLDII